MKTFTNSTYSLTLPDDWTIEQETDYVTFYKPDGVGDLLISSFHYEHDITENDILEFASEHLDNDEHSTISDYGDFSGLSFCYDTGGEYICEWYLHSDQVMLFITYSCPLEDEDKSEEDIVESILNSLKRK